MPRVYILPDGRQVMRGMQFTLGDVNYPSNWLELATEDDLAALGITVEELPEPEPPPPTVDDYEIAIQAYIDATARERSYRNGDACATYVNSTVPQWASEAQAFIAWRDSVWFYVYTELEKVENEQRPQPTVQEFIAELPAMTWPS